MFKNDAFWPDTFARGCIKESSLLKIVRPIKYLPASVTGRSFLPQMGMENLLEYLLSLCQSLAYRLNVSLQSIFIFEPSTTTHLGTNVLKKPRFVSLFMFVTVKTALEMSVTKTASEKRFDWFWWDRVMIWLLLLRALFIWWATSCIRTVRWACCRRMRLIIFRWVLEHSRWSIRSTVQ